MYGQLLTEGLLTYGYVTKAENVNLEVALPKGLTGIVNATNISPTYTSYLKSLVENGKKNLSQLADHTLSNLFPKGSFIVCKVISTKNGTFDLSLSPEDINCYIEQVQIKNNMILVGSVKSIEDHGYIIDIGLKDVYAFLSKENASKYNDGKQIKMGQQLQCLVVDVTRIKRNVIRSVTLSADPFKIATQMIKDPLPLPLSFICPGLQAEATIVKDEGSYLAAKFLTYNAVIPKCYCNPDGEGHEANSLVRATVLQYHPETKVIILTLRMIYSSDISEIFPDIFIGKIIKGAVKYISSENEIYLLLSNGLWAVAFPPDHTAQKRSALLKAYPVHSKHRCCVMKLVPLENLVEVCLSWKPNKANSESSSLKDTLPADESKTKIPEIEEEETSTKNGNVVSHEVEEAEESRSEITKLVKTSKVANLDRIGKLSHGTILKKLENSFKVLLASSGKFAVLPKMHLSDFQNHCDMLWDIYSEGNMMRVVNFKNLNKATICSSKLSLRLTAKKGNFVQSFNNIHVGQNLIGIVKTVVDYGVFVEFPGGLLSLAVTKDITADPDINLHKYFKEGMTVSTHVCGINQKKRQFRVSLKLRKTDIDSDFQLTYFRNYFKDKNIIIDHLKSRKDCPWLFEDLHTGDLCHVTVTEVVKEGVHCTLESGTKGFIATHHRKGLTVKKDMTVAAVILDMDLLQGIVQLAASPVVVKQVMKMKKKPEEIPKNKKLKSLVLLVRKEFVIVLLKMKGKAKLAYLSPKMHMNDVFNWDYYKVGDKLLVQYVRRINGKYIVKLYQPDKQIAWLTKRLQETTSQPKSARISKEMAVDPDSTTLESSKLKKKKRATKRKSEGNIDSDDDDGTGKDPKEKKCKRDSKKTKIPEIEEEETSTKNGNVVSHEVEEAEESRSEITKLVKTSKVANLDRIGKLSHGTILKKLENSFKVLLASSGKFAVLPKMHLSDFQNHCDMLWDIYSEGDMMRVVNFKNLNKATICSSKLSLRLTAKKGNFVQSFNNIHVGQNLIGIVKTVVDYGVFVEFPGGLLSLAVTKDITADPDINLHKYFKEGMTVSTHVCGINQKKRQFRVSLKLRKTDIDSDFQLTYFRNYFKDKNIIIDHLKSRKDCPWLFEDLHTGDLCHVTVTEVVKEGVHCTLESGTKGFIATHHRKGLTVKKDTTVAAVILDMDLLQGIVQLAASPVVVKQVMKMKKKPEEIPKNKKLKSLVLLVRKEFVIVLLKMKGKAKLAYLSPKMHMNDVFNWDYYKVGDKLLVQYVRRINGKYIVKLYQPVKQIARLTKRLQETASQPKSARISKEMAVDPDSTTLESSKLKKKKRATKRKSEGNIDSDDDDGTGKDPKEKKCKRDSKKSIEVMPPVFFNWDNETVAPTNQNGHVSSSDDDIEMSEDKDGESSTGKLLKKKKAAKKLEKKQEEERLYEIERQRVIGEKLPETADDFDRLLLHSPDSSMLWLRYMAFHLETAEIDKARSIAERALKTILFREEQEKFNVWIAYLNLENLYGSKENLNAVLQRALQQNQPLKVYQQLVNIYTKSGKIQAARDVYDILLKRFRKEKDVWIHFAIFCFKNGFLEQGRELIEKAVQVIDKKNHVTLVSKIAQLEFKYGDIQRGTTMFENIISNYPRRTDLWSIYIDMAMSQDDNEQIRHLFQRVTNLRLSSRKMKFFYKRYLDFEEKNGDKESQEAVREKAKQYVNELD